jgi:hypothetical protein
LKPVVVVPVAIIALGLAGFMAYKTLAPPPMTTPPLSPGIQWVREIAARTKGDMSKLTPDEKKKLEDITQGQGQRALNYYVDPRSEYGR